MADTGIANTFSKFHRKTIQIERGLHHFCRSAHTTTNHKRVDAFANVFWYLFLFVLFQPSRHKMKILLICPTAQNGSNGWIRVVRNEKLFIYFILHRVFALVYFANSARNIDAVPKISNFEIWALMLKTKLAAHNWMIQSETDIICAIKYG